jgi:SAM-dependent methyltransferase
MATFPLLAKLLADFRARHPRSLQGVEEARAISPEQFDRIAEMFLGWAVATVGEDALPRLVDAFILFTYEVNRAQALYEEDRRYMYSTFAECEQLFYSQDEFMDDYLWGIYLTNFLWVHHFEICLFYRDRFLARLPAGAQLVEIAPGHGGWGVWALSAVKDSRLEGFDLSAQSVRIASSLAQGAGVAERARYIQADAMKLPDRAEHSTDGCICCFLAEHLERPDLLFEAIGRRLKPGHLAFITAAVTAAQVDHIYEYRRESEVVAMCEGAGLRVLETLSAHPRRTLPNPRYLPRSMALVVTPRTNEIW